MTEAQNSLSLSEDVRLIDHTVEKPVQAVNYDDDTRKDQHEKPDDNANLTVDDEKTEKKSSFKILKTLSGRGKYTLLLATSASMLAGVTFSLIGPIYPFEATRKGMNTTLIGFVYGLFGVVIFCTAPFFGSNLTKLGPKFTFITGIFVGGCCNILFGTLLYCPSGTPFIVMSILIRGTEAIGFSAYLTSSFAMASSEFKDNIGVVFGILETGNGIGFMLGPIIGGALYELGGFELPFYVAGVLVLINGLLAYKFLPDVEDIPTKRKGSMLNLLRSPMILISIVCLLLAQLCMTTFESTFAKHAKNLDISVGTIGNLFGFVAMMYSITSLFWGYISDTLDYQAPLLIGAQLVLGFAFWTLGPSFLFPFIPFTLPTAGIGVGLLGISFGGIFIPTMKCMANGAIELGYDNNADTFALVSGLFNAAQTLGGFLGPVAMGALVTAYGYPICYTITGMIPISMMVVCLVFFTLRYYRRTKNNTYEDLNASSINAA